MDFQNNVDNSQTTLGTPLNVESLDDALADVTPSITRRGGEPPEKEIVPASEPAPKRQKVIDGVTSVDRAKKDIVKTTKDIIYGQNDYPETQQRIINKYGEYKIKNIKVGRTPLPSILTKVLNVVSLGGFNKLLDKSPYDKLFHLFIIITLSNGSVIKILLEKNETLNMKVVSNTGSAPYDGGVYNPKGAEYIEVSKIPNNLTFADLINGARKLQGSNFFKYNALYNNCQDFIIDVLKGSNILNESLRSFIKQDVKSIFKNYPLTRKFINTLTDIGGKIDLVRKNLKL